MATIEIQKTRKVHKCDYCETEIPIGSPAYFKKFVAPRYEEIDGYDKQVGIQYVSFYLCADWDDCDLRGMVVAGLTKDEIKHSLEIKSRELEAANFLTTNND
jgi:hypothetical protein